MAHKSLQRHILRLITATLAGLALAIMLAVWLSTWTHVREQVQQDLGTGGDVLQQLLDTREQLLLNSAEVLTADFGFKQAVATQDAATIESALENHGARINADLMALISLDGLTVASNTSALASHTRFPFQDLLKSAVEQGGQNGFILLDHKLYQVIILPVRAPIAMGLAVIGFHLDKTFALATKKVIDLDVSFMAGKDPAKGAIISTLDDNQLQQALAQRGDTSHLRLPFSSSLHYVSRTLALPGNQHISILLSTALNDAYAKFDLLQLEIALISLLAATLALWGSSLFARKLTRPMEQLVTMADDIASGHYRREVQVSRNIIEVGQLTSAFNRMQAEISEREARIIHQAHHDPLTGLINRPHAVALLNDTLLQNPQQRFMAIMLNVQGFRTINDTFGYQVADQCLRHLSERLQALAGGFQLTARLVGDEFLLIVPDGALDPQRLQQELQETLTVRDLEINLRIMVGVARYPDDADHASALIQKAGIALDMARREKRELAFYDHKVEETHLKRLMILTDLKQALLANDGQLRMYYQPKICARTLSASRFEALIRWIHPDQGFIPPDLFIPLAEQAGLINNLTEWVVENVIQQIARWQQQDFSAQIAVNLSAQDLSRQHLLDLINSLLQRHGVPASALSFEITESELMSNPEHAIALLKHFREQGFNLAIDDFGTGYSSLSQLKNMPVTELKIDRSFVMQLDKAEDDQIIVRSTIDLAHSFNLEIVAEGVENAAAFNLLQKWGVNWVQGYHFSRPLPASDILVWIDSFNQQRKSQRQ